jgi:hypothetical protein
MPARFFFDSELCLSIVEFSGIFTADDLEAMDNLIIASPWVDKRILDISDLRGVTRMDLTSDDLDASVRRWAQLYATTKMRKLAMVAPQDFSFGQSRVYAGLAGERPYATRVMRDINLAEEWFGIPPGTVDRIIAGPPAGSVGT